MGHQEVATPQEKKSATGFRNNAVRAQKVGDRWLLSDANLAFYNKTAKHNLKPHYKPPHIM